MTAVQDLLLSTGQVVYGPPLMSLLPHIFIIFSLQWRERADERGQGAMMVEKVERLKAVNLQVDGLSKTIQELDASAKSYRVVWRFNERKIEHGLKRDESAARRSYHLALGITIAVMYLAPKASKIFS